MRKISLVVLSAILLSSCVSKKKYVALETENGQLKSELTKTRVENEELEAKFAKIQQRVDEYNNKINSLTEESNAKMVNVDGVVMSEDAKVKMRETLKNVPAEYLVGATTLKDSMNAAIAYNIKNSANDIDESDDIAVKVEETVVMISISDKMLFKSGSYKVTDKADAILQKIADVINSEESLDVMVEGHTDDKKMVENAAVKDNWDLSVLRATSVVKRLQNNFAVAPEKLIAAGRSFYQPLVDNDSAENRAKNRRTRIVVLPKIDQFYDMVEKEMKNLSTGTN